MKPQRRGVREDLILSHRWLVKVIARGMSYRGEPPEKREERIQAGMVGLIEAVDEFDPARGTTLAQFARLKIRRAMLREFFQFATPLTMNDDGPTRDVFFKVLGLIRERRLHRGMGSDDVVAIAIENGLDLERTLAMYRAMLGALSLDRPQGTMDGGTITLYDVVTGDFEREPGDCGREPHLADLIRREEHDWYLARRAAALEGMKNRRERRILIARKLTAPPVPLKTLAAKMGISISRVRQIEEIACKRFREIVLENEKSLIVRRSFIPNRTAGVWNTLHLRPLPPTYLVAKIADARYVADKCTDLTCGTIYWAPTLMSRPTCTLVAVYPPAYHLEQQFDEPNPIIDWLLTAQISLSEIRPILHFECYARFDTHWWVEHTRFYLRPRLTFQFFWALSDYWAPLALRYKVAPGDNPHLYEWKSKPTETATITTVFV